MCETWKSCIYEKPKCDGDYYVYVSHLQYGDELRISTYKNEKWLDLLDDEKVIAWKKIEEKKIEDKNAWLKDHVKDIQKIFGLDEVNINEFEIAETMVKCICEYSSWFHYDQVYLIDGVYVIHVLFA